jgi:ADP-heptose:LPS heptosyltransferase
LNSSAEHNAEAVEHILVIRFSSLGDILLIAPVLRALRRRFPSAHIDLLVAREFSDAAHMIDGPDRILEFDRAGGFKELLQWRSRLSRCYHVVVDLQNNFRSSFLRALIFPTLWVKARRYRFRRWLLIHFKWNLYGEIRPVPVRYLDAVQMIGAVHDDRGLDLRVDTEAVRWLQETYPSLCSATQPFIVLCPGARHFTKRWPKEQWIILGELLCSRGKQVIVIGDTSESALVKGVAGNIQSAIPVIGESIQHIAALLQKAESVVTNDSGIMHLAAGVGAPLTTIFGSTALEFGFAPFTNRAKIIEQKLSCRPCTAFGREDCPKRHFNCMMKSTPEAVLEKINELTSDSTAE